LECMLEAGAVADEPYEGVYPLMCAVSTGSVAIVKCLMDAGASINVQSATGYTPLMLAARLQDVRIVCKLLCDSSIEVNKQGEAGVTALTVATDTGNTEILDLLMRAGAVAPEIQPIPADIPVKRVEERTGEERRGEESYEQAAISGVWPDTDVSLSSFDFVPPQSPSITHIFGTTRQTAAEALPVASEATQARSIVEAAAAGNMPALRFLTDPSCVPPTIPGEALVEAMQASHTAAVTHLLQAGVDVTRPVSGHSQLLINFRGDQRGITPMNAACIMGSLQYARLLHTHDAPIELLDVHAAVEHGLDVELLRFLLTTMDGTLVCKEDLTALLLLAIIKGKPEMVQYLIDKGASTARQLLNAVACSPLPFSVAIVQRILAAGVDINLRSIVGETALQLAVNRRNAGVVQLLLQQPGIDIYAKGGEDPRSVVMIAVENGDAAIVKLLLDAGCPQRTSAVLPLCVAVHNGKLSVVPVLLDAGADPTGCIQCCIHPSVTSHVRRLVTTVGTPLLPEYARIFPSSPLPTTLNEVDIAIALVLHRGDINRCDAGKLTPLAWACKRGNTPLVAGLLFHGAVTQPPESSVAVDATPGNTCSPLSIAVTAGRWDIVGSLLRVNSLPS
jgi:ankyrin repeat protein